MLKSQSLCASPANAEFPIATLCDSVLAALANADNYDNDGNVIDDYVAADVYIAMSDDNFENVDDMINEVLKEHEIYESNIRRVA